jgi:homocysteine S-methyltransferase
MSNAFLDALLDHPLVADGAMGTQLYERGVLYTTNYEELCASRPELIKSIHKEYLKAGAQLIETNSFGANRFRLAKSNLEGRVRELNETSLRLAREAVAEEKDAFFSRVRAGFESILATEPERIVRVDAGGDVATVADAVWRQLASRSWV